MEVINNKTDAMGMRRGEKTLVRQAYEASRLPALARSYLTRCRTVHLHRKHDHRKSP